MQFQRSSLFHLFTLKNLVKENRKRKSNIIFTYPLASLRLYAIQSRKTFSDTQDKKRKKAVQSTAEDRWQTSGSSPGSDDVLYDYNLLRSMLPTAVQDNMFRPLREHTETGPSAVPSLLKRSCDCKTTLECDAFLEEIKK